MLHLLYKYTNLRNLFIKYLVKYNYNIVDIFNNNDIYNNYHERISNFLLPDYGITINNWYETDNFKYFDPNDVINKYLKSKIDSESIMDIKNTLIKEDLSYNDSSSFNYGLKLFNILKPLIDSYVDTELKKISVLKLLRINDINDITDNTDKNKQVFTKEEKDGNEILNINNNQFCKDIIKEAEELYNTRYIENINFKDLIEKYKFTPPIFDQSYKTNALVARNTGIHRLLSKQRNVLTFGIGYSGIGKSYTLFGDTKKQHMGIVQEIFKFIDKLNDRLQIRIYEIHGMASPYSSLWNTGNVEIKYSYYNLSDDNYTLIETNYEEIKSNEYFYDKPINYILNFSEHIEKIEKIRKDNGFILENRNNPVSSRAILVIDIKGKSDEKEFKKTIFDLPGKEDIKHTYDDINIKEFNINNTIFKDETYKTVFNYLITNPLLICLIPELSRNFVSHCEQKEILENINKEYYIYILQNDNDVLVYNLDALKDKHKFDIFKFNDSIYIQYKCLHYICYLIFTNNFEIIISFFQTLCDEIIDKNKIKMIYQGYFINEILIGIFEKTTSVMKPSSEQHYKQVRKIIIDEVEQSLSKTVNNITYERTTTSVNRNFFDLQGEHKKLNEFRYLVSFFQMVLQNYDESLFDRLLSAMKKATPNLLDNYDFMIRYSQKNPLEKLFNDLYNSNDYLYTALVLVQNTINSEKPNEYNCNKIINQMILLKDAKPFLS